MRTGAMKHSLTHFLYNPPSNPGSPWGDSIYN